jgi:DNA polymerase III gamma/tau subunit
MQQERKDKLADSPYRISNGAVLEYLQNQKKGKRKHNKQLKHKKWIEERVFEYLKSSPCLRLDASRRREFRSILHQPSYSSDQKESDEPSNGFGLTETEALQVMDFMPKESVELHLMINELHTRMPESQQDMLMDTISSFTVATNTTTNVAQIDSTDSGLPVPVKPKLKN